MAGHFTRVFTLAFGSWNIRPYSTLTRVIYLDIETKGSKLFRDPKALGCSDPERSEGATKGLRVSK